jgi:hypothetical protein
VCARARALGYEMAKERDFFCGIYSELRGNSFLLRCAFWNASLTVLSSGLKVHSNPDIDLQKKKAFASLFIGANDGKVVVRVLTKTLITKKIQCCCVNERMR